MRGAMSVPFTTDRALPVADYYIYVDPPQFLKCVMCEVPFVLSGTQLGGKLKTLRRKWRLSVYKSFFSGG